MKISSKNLIDLPVETQSGKKLGKLESFLIDVDTQGILEYLVKPTLSVVNKIINTELVIARGQVVEINDQKMIVDDNVVESTKLASNKKANKQKVAQGVSMKDV